MDHLKMLSSDEMFEYKQGWFTRKVTPEPPPHPQQEPPPQQEPQMTQDQDQFHKALIDFSNQLNEQAVRQQNRESRLKDDEQRFEQEKETFQKENEQFKAMKRETDDLNETLKKEKQIMDGKKRKIREERAILAENDKSYRLTRQTFLENVKSEAQRNFKVFMCLCYDDIRYMISTQKLRCIIPPKTTKWFMDNLDNAGQTTNLAENYVYSNNIYELLVSLNADFDIPSNDNLCIHTKQHSPRIVVIFLKSRLREYAEQSYSGNKNLAIDSLHQPQKDDKYQMDQRTYTNSI
jgi:hypothetical protein